MDDVESGLLGGRGGYQSKQVSLTEDMKLEAVVVTVVQVEEDEYLRALARKVHITALQVNSSPPHSSLRGMWSWRTGGTAQSWSVCFDRSRNNSLIWL